MTSGFDPLIAELDAWSRAGRCAAFWLRDDDAMRPTPALDRLLQLGAGKPLTLAVIPQGTDTALAEHIAPFAGVEVAVHGWAHVNHAAIGAKSCELGADRPAPVVLADLTAGLVRIRALFGTQALPVLVPPWNRIAPKVVAGLADAGFSALSVFGPEAHSQPRRINTHVDMIDWRGTRGARATGALVADLVARLRQIGEGPGHVGVLTHHLVHDEAAWSFLHHLFAVTRAHPGCRWVSLGQLMRSADAV